MGLSNLNPHQKKIGMVIGVAVVLYLYLSFGPLGINPKSIIFEFINAILLIMTLQFDLISPNVSGLVFDALLCVGGFTFWVAFFAQHLGYLQSNWCQEDRRLLYTHSDHVDFCWLCFWNDCLKKRTSSQVSGENARYLRTG